MNRLSPILSLGDPHRSESSGSALLTVMNSHDSEQHPPPMDSTFAAFPEQRFRQAPSSERSAPAVSSDRRGSDRQAPDNPRRDFRPDSRQRQAPLPDRRDSDRRESRMDPTPDRPRSTGRREASPPLPPAVKRLQTRIGDLQSELAQLVSTHINGDNGKTRSSRQDSSAAHVAIAMPSSYDDEIPSHTALGAIHIEPETWAPTLPRAAAYSSDDEY